MHWRRKWQPTPVFLPGESQGWGAWWAAIYGVTQSQTRLMWLNSSSSSGLYWCGFHAGFTWCLCPCGDPLKEKSCLIIWVNLPWVGITICLPCWLPERLCGSVLPLIPVLPCSFAWNYPTTPQVFFLKNTDSQHADFLAFCPSDPLSHSFQAFSRQITSILPPKDQNSASVFFFLVQVLCQIWEVRTIRKEMFFSLGGSSKQEYRSVAFLWSPLLPI